ncbi:MAG: TRAP transporter large permease [Oscillospiraceae bacterium]|nr:TRAP transporter large permease [Oscillospiraceae bacterium]
MSLEIIAIMGIIIMLLLMFSGMNIGMAMLVVGFVGYAIVVNFSGAMGILRTTPVAQATKYSFTVIPLFMVMGNAAFVSGLSNGLYDACNKWLSRMPGGVACATTAACAGFGAICGSVVATTATMGTIAIPEMKERGYSNTLAVGIVSASGGLGILIPPSTTMIVYGISTELSIGKLFASGVFPGIVQAIMLMITVQIIILVNPASAPKGFKCAWKDRFQSLKGLIGVVVLFLAVLGGMFVGIFTVNEAAAIGAFLGLLMMVVRRKMTWKNFAAVMKDSVKTSSMVFLLLIGATVFGNFLTISRLPMNLANFISSLEVSRYVILAAIIIIYAVLGCIMDALPMILLTIPIFYPIILGLGFDGIWFGVIIVLVVNLGLITPPVGLNCYVIKGIAKDIPLQTIFKGALPFCFSMIATIALCTIFPQIAVWLPNLLYRA